MDKSMKIIEIAQEIYTSSLNSPTDISVSSISFYLREAAVGKFNNLLGLDLTIGTDAQLSRNLTEAEKSIFKLIYLVNYYDYQTRTTLGAAGTDAVLEVSDFGTTVRKINRSEVSKRWMELRKMTQEDLNDQVRAYNMNDVRPVQCTGDDTTYSLAGGLSNTNTSDVI